MCSQAGHDTLDSLKHQLEEANAKLASLEAERAGEVAAEQHEQPEPTEAVEGEEPNPSPEGESEAPAEQTE